jgi:hypothetical protein
MTVFPFARLIAAGLLTMRRHRYQELLRDGVRNAQAVVRESDAVWLRRSACHGY